MTVSEMRTIVVLNNKIEEIYKNKNITYLSF